MVRFQPREFLIFLRKYFGYSKVIQYCTYTTVYTVLYSTVATVLLQQYCCNSTVARVLLQQYCCNSTVATVLLQEYCCNSTGLGLGLALALGLGLGLGLGLALALALAANNIFQTKKKKMFSRCVHDFFIKTCIRSCSLFCVCSLWLLEEVQTQKKIHPRPTPKLA